MSHTIIGDSIRSARGRSRCTWFIPIFGALVLLFALFLPGGSDAQDMDANPIRLVTGNYLPGTIKPAEAQVSPDAVFNDKYFKLIQFPEIPTEIERQGWAAAGMRLVDYLPDDTYFAVIDEDFELYRLSDQALTIVDVPDVVRFEPALASLRARGQSTDQLVVSYYATLDAKDVITALEARDAVVQDHRDYSRQLDIVIDPRRLNDIIALPFLQFLGLPPEEPVLEGYDHRNATGRSNYLNTGYNGLNYNGAGVVIGIGEGGTVGGLVDVKGRLAEMTDGAPASHKIGVMQNAGGGGNLDPANRNNAWGATFLSIDDPDYAALYVSHNLRYTNHSYGVSISAGYDQTARDHDLRIATYPNHLVIYSAGNSGNVQGYAPYNFAACPTDLTACWANITGQMKQNKNMLAVGALDPADHLTYFSSRGPMYDGRVIPQVAIEGIEGTSDAAPKVTGELAMLAQVYKDKNGGAEPTSSLLRAIIINTADDLGNSGPDYKHGYGRPNMRRAYNVIDNAQFLVSSISNGATNSHSLAVPAGTRQVRVMLVWPDVAASVGANPAIVNNLNLLLKDPPATTGYNPWVLDPTANPVNLDLAATRGADNLNTIEQVTVDDPAAGTWTVEVSGFNVPFGPQTYYLTYEFLGDQLHMAFPLQDHRFVPGTSYQIKWDSYGGSGTFDLAYRLDGGSWVTIITSHDAASRIYQWTAPAVTGIHAIEFRVQRGALTATSNVNYIGAVSGNLDLHWACADGVRLVWDPVDGATSYKVYRLGAQYMEEVVSNITFDGTSATLTDQSTLEDEYYAVSAVTYSDPNSYEGLRTMAVTKAVGDYNCFNVQTTLASSVDDTDVTLTGWVNPHGSVLDNVHFEYGPTTSYGSSTADISISASGHAEEAVSLAIASPMSDRADVLHFRLAADKDGMPVYGDDREVRLSPGNDFRFDGTDDYVNLSVHPSLPIYRNGPGTGYSITFWIKGSPPGSGRAIYTERSSTSGNPGLTLQTSGSYPNGMWVLLYNDNGASLINSSRNMQLLDNTWHHFAWVDANGTVKIYLDGNQNGSDILYTPTSVTLDRSAVGARYRNLADNFFPGAIDEASFWDKALSAQEIRALMHQTLQGDETNLKAYYRLDDGPASRVFDAVTGVEASISGGGSKGFSTVPMGTAGTLVQTATSTSVGEAGKQLTVKITSPAPGTNYLGIYKTGHGGNRVTAESFPTGVSRRCSILWGIREYGNVTADLVIDYSNVPDITDSSAIRLLKRTDAAGEWADVTGDFVHNTTDRTFTKTGEIDFSEFSIGDNGPTAVALAWFDGTAIDDGSVLLEWETASELDLLGFYLYRAESPGGNPTRLHDTPIPAHLPGSPTGGSYSFQDRTTAPGTTYYYWLEALYARDTPVRYGPRAVATTPVRAFKTHLPLVIGGD